MPGPAKRVEEMSPEERLRSLQEFAEEQKYVRPGEGGTLPTNTAGGMNSLVFGGPMRTDQSTGYQGNLAPPSYETATGESSAASSKRPGPFTRWKERRRAKKASKD